ncbi:MAG: hypothetical protein AAGG81_03775 [Chlamydiota bacterium]
MCFSSSSTTKINPIMDQITPHFKALNSDETRKLIKWYGKQDNNRHKLFALFYRIWNAVKSIIGQSDWQLTIKNALKHDNKGLFCKSRDVIVKELLLAAVDATYHEDLNVNLCAINELCRKEVGRFQEQVDKFAYLSDQLRDDVEIARAALINYKENGRYLTSDANKLKKIIFDKNFLMTCLGKGNKNHGAFLQLSCISNYSVFLKDLEAYIETDPDLKTALANAQTRACEQEPVRKYSFSGMPTCSLYHS